MDSRPAYTPTDFVPIAGAALFVVLDLLTLVGVLHLDKSQEATIVATFSSLATVMVGLFVAHRAVKHVVLVTARAAIAPAEQG